MKFLRQWFSSLLKRRHGGILIAVGLALVVGSMTRLALLIKAASDISWNSSLLVAFLVGAFFDLAAALWCVFPLTLLLALLPRSFFEKQYARVLAHLSLLVILYIL